MLELLQKADIFDSEQRIDALVSKWEKVLRNRFVVMVSKIKSSQTLEELIDLIVAGRVEEAIAVGESHLAAFANSVNQAVIDAGDDTARLLNSKNIIVNFDVSNSRAVQIFQSNKLELIRELQEQQRLAIHQSISRSLQGSVNPREAARGFRDAIGLTAKQEQAVVNYRTLLEERSSVALDRKLRDRRFDKTIKRSIKTGKPLTEKQVNRMVSRYRERSIKFRSETIARTEALPSVHQGTDEMYNQAIESGELNAEEMIQIWHAAKDARTRDPHRKMQSQTRRIGEPFRSGAGNLLKYPGDRNAPASETIRCRCRKSTRIRGE